MQRTPNSTQENFKGQLSERTTERKLEMLSDLEITREPEAANVWTTLASVGEPAKQYEEWTADNVNTGLPRSENDEKEIYGARNKVPTEKGRQYILEKIKNDRKSTLSNVTRQINKIKPLLSSFSTENLCI